ncbi:MAG TPA: membrane dipeptidase [Gaiellaceae bacterium]|jgi:membrane dipeptidase
MTSASELHADAVVWDQHGCLPLRPDSDAIDQLDLYRSSGVDFISINVGFDVTSALDTLKVLAAFRRGVLTRPDRFVLVSTAADVREAKASGRLAVSFDLEGTEPLDGELALVSTYYDLGVRTMLMAYNRTNRCGGGCHDDPEQGLTDFGREVVAEMNRLGMLVDATHCSRRTTFDLFEASSAPVVFSHSVPLGVRAHDRNISDEQMRACAATGGVVGINGVGIFLGENDASTEAVVRAVEYAVDVVGADHVGLGLDYVFDQDELNAYLEENRDTFPPGSGYGDYFPHRFASPAQLPEVTEALLGLGYPEDAVRGIMGGNWLRVAEQVWR